MGKKEKKETRKGRPLNSGIDPFRPTFQNYKFTTNPKEGQRQHSIDNTAERETAKQIILASIIQEQQISKSTQPIVKQ